MEEGEEGRKAIGLAIPQSVSNEEKEAHELTHTPYRAWCRHCVRGRGKNMGHRKSNEDKSEATVPRVSMDYFFMSTKDERASDNPLIVMVDETTGEKYARAVGRKGLGTDGEMDWLIKDISMELKIWGHAGGHGGEIILKCDSENPIIVVRDAIAKYHGGRVIPEAPAKNESKSNGVVEEAGKTVREFTRVIKEQIETDAKMTIQPSDVITLWMVRWAAMMVSRFLVGKDGRTAHERRRGRKCKIPVAKCGESVWYKRIRESKERKDKFESEWEEGIWLGHSRASNEVLIGTDEGVVRTYTVKRKPEGERWSSEKIKSMKGTPHRPDPNKPGTHIPIRVTFDGPEEGEVLKTEAPRKEVGRRMNISAAILRKYGFSDGCDGCRYHRTGIQDPNARKPHSEACRERIRNAMLQDDTDKEKIGKEDERINGKIAEQLEKSTDEKDKTEDNEDTTKDLVEDHESEERQKKRCRISNENNEDVEEESKNTGGAESSKKGRKRSTEDEDQAESKKKRKEGMNERKDDEGDTEMISQIKVICEGTIGKDKWVVKDEDIIDVTEGYNFNKRSDRQKLLRMVKEAKPMLIIGSPMYKVGKTAHSKFVNEMYNEQAENQRWFLHEVVPRVRRKCRKKEDFITNSECIDRQMMKEGATMSDAIYKGMAEEVQLNKQGLKKIIDISKLSSVQKSEYQSKAKEWHSSEEFDYAYDDVSGNILCPKEVRRARLKEIEYIQRKKVYVKIPRRQAIANGWKIIKTRWIDVNKGDEKNPQYRSRFVGKEFNDGEDAAMFAATPPLEALKVLISEASTGRHGERVEEKVIMINDVARAFFEAPVRRKICVELPEEDKSAKDRAGDMVGLLVQSLYGTRDAASNFQKEVQKLMEAIGFKTGKYNVSTYYHAKRDLKTLVHGDDFVTTGSRENMAWLKTKLEKRFEIKTTVLGLGNNEVREARLLNRIIGVCEKGWRYEADPRHAELIIRGLNMQDAKGVKTPGEDQKPWCEVEDAEALPVQDATPFRALAARANYLSPDRPDAQYAIKEICRGMASPTRGDLKKLRRLARYLLERPRLILEFPFQVDESLVKGYSDSDWAGCRRTAKSTSGGCIMKGQHCVKSWATTQKSVTLSSAEAELVAAVKMSAELLGLEQLMAEWGVQVRSEVLIDSSAALGVVSRKGNGKLRHIKVGMLWVQEKQESEELSYKKVPGVENPADLMTKNLTQSVIDSHLERINAIISEGRATLAPAL